MNSGEWDGKLCCLWMFVAGRSFQAGLRYDPEHSDIKKAHKQLRGLEKKTKAVGGRDGWLWSEVDNLDDSMELVFCASHVSTLALRLLCCFQLPNVCSMM